MILKLGSRGDGVTQLQKDLQALAAAGVYKPAKRVAVDGIFGEGMEETLKQAQRALGLTADGVAGDETLTAFAAKLHAVAGANVTPLKPKQQSALRNLLVQIATKEIGTREVGGDNSGVRVRDYQTATDLRPLGAWPWGAAFVAWCIREWVAQPSVQTAFGWGDENTSEQQRPKTAQAFALLDWARSNGHFVLPPSAKVQPGMLALYEVSHVGIVKKLTGKSFLAIEGNASGCGEDGITADGVWVKKRTRREVRNFIGWNLRAAEPPKKASTTPAPTKPIEVHVPPAPTALPGTVPEASRGVGAIPRESLEFIIDEEGMDQPWRFPGGESGVTLGHGYDLGCDTTLDRDWEKWLTEDQLSRLSRALRKNGKAAEAMCPQFRDIKITTEAADDVFYRWTVPKYYWETIEAFPKMDLFPGSVQGALLSLVFNRGTSLCGARRQEMREIHDLIATGDPSSENLKAIAEEFREMKKLWAGKGLDGLVVRREKEARWVESAIA